MTPWYGCCRPNARSWYCLVGKGHSALAEWHDFLLANGCYTQLITQETDTLIFDGDLFHGPTELCLVIWHRLQEKNHQALDAEIAHHYISITHIYGQTYPEKKQRMFEPARTFAESSLCIEPSKWSKNNWSKASDIISGAKLLAEHLPGWVQNRLLMQ